jgi:hypothetical protein
MSDRIKMENIESSEKTKLYTGHSMLSANEEESLNTLMFKKQSDIFNSNISCLNFPKDCTPASKINKLIIKTVISEDSNDNNL